MSQFERIWAGEREPRLQVVRPNAPAPAPASEVGDSAQRFLAWTAERLAALRAEAHQPSLVEINRFKVRVADRLLAEYLATPEPQRSIVRDHTGKPGLLGVFVAVLQELSDLALEVEPPPLWEPPKPSKRKKEKLSQPNLPPVVVPEG